MCIGCAPGWVRPGRQRGRLDFGLLVLSQRAACCAVRRLGCSGSASEERHSSQNFSNPHICDLSNAVRWWPCAVPRSCLQPGAGCESMLLRAPGRERGASPTSLPACLLHFAPGGALRPSIPHGVPGADAAAWSGDSVRRSCTYQIMLDELLK